MKIRTKMNLSSYSNKSIDKFIEVAVGKPFKDSEGEVIGKIVEASRSDEPRVVDLIVEMNVEEEVTPMKAFYSELQAIGTKKILQLRELEATTPESIDCPILECEINDAQAMMIIMNADVPHDHKLSGIKAIYSQTTSSSIYEATQKLFKEEGVSLEG